MSLQQQVQYNFPNLLHLREVPEMNMKSNKLSASLKRGDTNSVCIFFDPHIGVSTVQHRDHIYNLMYSF